MRVAVGLVMVERGETRLPGGRVFQAVFSRNRLLFNGLDRCGGKGGMGEAF